MIPYIIPEERVDVSEWDAQVNAYLADSKANGSVERLLHPVVFNPNEVDSVTLAAMGLPPKLTANWIKYLGKGGRFRNHEGVKKIYGMTSGLFNQLDSFMVFPESGDDLAKPAHEKGIVKVVAKLNPVPPRPNEEFVKKKKEIEKT